MLHEILLALAGCPGNTFAVSRQSGLFEVRVTLECIFVISDGGRSSITYAPNLKSEYKGG